MKGMVEGPRGLARGGGAWPRPAAAAQGLPRRRRRPQASEILGRNQLSYSKSSRRRSKSSDVSAGRAGAPQGHQRRPSPRCAPRRPRGRRPVRAGHHQGAEVLQRRRRPGGHHHPPWSAGAHRSRHRSESRWRPTAASSQPVPRTRHNAVVVVASFSEPQRCSAWWPPQGRAGDRGGAPRDAQPESPHDSGARLRGRWRDGFAANLNSLLYNMRG